MIELLIGIMVGLIYTLICIYRYEKHQLRMIWLRMVYPCLYLSIVVGEKSFKELIKTK